MILSLVAVAGYGQQMAAVAPGDTGSVSLPMAAGPLSLPAESIRVSMDADPALDLQILPTSQLGPTTISPGTTQIFQLDYQIGPNATIGGHFPVVFHFNVPNPDAYFDPPDESSTVVTFTVQAPPPLPPPTLSNIQTSTHVVGGPLSVMTITFHAGSTTQVVTSSATIFNFDGSPFIDANGRQAQPVEDQGLSLSSSPSGMPWQGDETLTWSGGRLTDGNPLPDGFYSLCIVVTDQNGQISFLDHESSNQCSPFVVRAAPQMGLTRPLNRDIYDGTFEGETQDNPSFLQTPIPSSMTFTINGSVSTEGPGSSIEGPSIRSVAITGAAPITPEFDIGLAELHPLQPQPDPNNISASSPTFLMVGSFTPSVPGDYRMTITDIFGGQTVAPFHLATMGMAMVPGPDTSSSYNRQTGAWDWSVAVKETASLGLDHIIRYEASKGDGAVMTGYPLTLGGNEAQNLFTGKSTGTLGVETVDSDGNWFNFFMDISTGAIGSLMGPAAPTQQPLYVGFTSTALAPGSESSVGPPTGILATDGVTVVSTGIPVKTGATYSSPIFDLFASSVLPGAFMPVGPFKFPGTAIVQTTYTVLSVAYGAGEAFNGSLKPRPLGDLVSAQVQLLAGDSPGGLSGGGGELFSGTITTATLTPIPPEGLAIAGHRYLQIAATLESLVPKDSIDPAFCTEFSQDDPPTCQDSQGQPTACCTKGHFPQPYLTALGGSLVGMLTDVVAGPGLAMQFEPGTYPSSPFATGFSVQNLEAISSGTISVTLGSHDADPSFVAVPGNTVFNIYATAYGGDHGIITSTDDALVPFYADPLTVRIDLKGTHLTVKQLENIRLVNIDPGNLSSPYARTVDTLNETLTASIHKPVFPLTLMALAPASANPGIVQNNGFTLTYDQDLNPSTIQLQPADPNMQPLKGLLAQALAQGLAPVGSIEQLTYPAENFRGPTQLQAPFSSPPSNPARGPGLYRLSAGLAPQLLPSQYSKYQESFISAAAPQANGYFVVLAQTNPVPITGPDVTPPTSRLNASGPAIVGPSNVTITTATTLSLSALDPPVSQALTSGLSTSYLLIDQPFVSMTETPPAGAPSAFSLPLGTHTLTYFSVDLAGNFETPRVSSVTALYIDVAAPVTQLVVFGSSSTDGDGNIISASTNPIGFSAGDPILSDYFTSGVQDIFYLVDADPTSESCANTPLNINAPSGTCANELYQGPFLLSTGTHIVYFFSADFAGNQEFVNMSTVIVTSPPVISTSTSPNPPGSLFAVARTSYAIEVRWDPNGNPSGTSYYVLYATAPSPNQCAVQSASFAQLVAQNTDVILNPLQANTSYLIGVCIGPNGQGCAQPIVAATNAGGFDNFFPYITCSTSTDTGGGPPPPPPALSNTLAVAVDSQGRPWTVVQTSATYQLERFSPEGALQRTLALPDAASGSNWAVEFDTAAGFVYAIGAASGPYTVGTDLSIYKATLEAVPVSSTGYHAGLNAQALGFDATGNAWITGMIQQGAGQNGPPPAKLALWRFNLQTGLLTLTTTYSRAGTDAGFGVRVVDGKIWVAGYSLNPQLQSLDLGLWAFDGQGQNLIAGPFFKPGYLTNLQSVDVSARLETNGSSLFVAAVRTSNGVNDLGFVAYDLSGQVLNERAWHSAAGTNIAPHGITLDQGGNVLVVGGLKAAGGATLGAWRYSSQGAFLGAATDAGVQQANGVAPLQSNFILAVNGSSTPYRFQASQALSGTDILISSAAPAVDTTRPVSSATITSPYFVGEGSAAFVSPASSITLSAFDPVIPGAPTSGVNHIDMALDTTTISAYSSTLSLPEGPHQLFFRAVDNAGNAEVVHQLALASDGTPPITTLSANGPSSGTFISAATFLVMNSTDLVSGQPTSGVSSVFYYIDADPGDAACVAAPFIATAPAGSCSNPDYSGPFNLSPGAHTVAYFAEDNVLNSENAHTASVFVDTVPPVTTLLVEGAPAVSTSIAIASTDTLSLAAADSGAGVETTSLAVDGAAHAAPFTLGIGTHTISFYSVDLVGNAETARGAFITVRSTVPPDVTPPSLALTPVSGSTLTAASPLIAAIYSDAGGVNASSVRLAVDGVDVTAQAVVTLSSAGFTPSSPLAQGSHVVTASVADLSGNAASAASSFFIDSVAPVTSLLVEGLPAVSTAIAVASTDTLSLTASDLGTGVASTSLSIDGAAQASPFTLSVGTHSASFFSIDNAGNAEAPRSVFITVRSTAPLDVTPPSLTLTPISGSTLTTASPLIAVVYADAGTGVDAAGVRISLDSTDVTAQAVVTASSASFTPASPLAQGPHAVAVTVADVSGNSASASTHFFIDSIAPVTQLLVDGNPTALLSLTAASTDTFSFSAADGGTGVNQTLYAVDGGQQAVYSSPFGLAAGNHTLAYQSVDRAGNAETPKFAAIAVTAPGGAPPIAAIISPEGQGFCADIKGQVQVLGTAASPTLASWKLENAVGQNAAFGFSAIASGITAVSSAALATWNTTPLSGWQTLRLTAMDASGQSSSFSVNVYVGDPSVLLSIARELKHPMGVAGAQSGAIYVADTNNDRINVYSQSGALIAAFGAGRGGKNAPTFNKPQDVAVDVFGNVYVADTNNKRALKLSSLGQQIFELPKLGHPQGIALDAAGSIYVSDTDNAQIKKYSQAGLLTQTFAVAGSSPAGLGLDLSGQLYAADPANHRVLVFSPSGSLLKTIGTGLGLERPFGVAVSGSGQCLVVSDARNNQLFKLDGQGAPNLIFGGKHSGFKGPRGLAFNVAGDLLVADRGQNRALKLGPPAPGMPAVPLTSPNAIETDVTEFIVAKDGGSLRRADRAALIVPPNALSDDLDLSISTPAIRLAEEEALKARKLEQAGIVSVSTGAVFGPDGTSFAAKNPATVVVPYDAALVQSLGLAELQLQLYYWDADKEKWVWITSTVDAQRKTVRGSTTHLSLYKVVGRKPQE